MHRRRCRAQRGVGSPARSFFSFTARRSRLRVLRSSATAGARAAHPRDTFAHVPERHLEVTNQAMCISTSKSLACPHHHWSHCRRALLPGRSTPRALPLPTAQGQPKFWRRMVCLICLLCESANPARVNKRVCCSAPSKRWAELATASDRCAPESVFSTYARRHGQFIARRCDGPVFTGPAEARGGGVSSTVIPHRCRRESSHTS